MILKIIEDDLVVACSIGVQCQGMSTARLDVDAEICGIWEQLFRSCWIVGAWTVTTADGSIIFGKSELSEGQPFHLDLEHSMSMMRSKCSRTHQQWSNKVGAWLRQHCTEAHSLSNCCCVFD